MELNSKSIIFFDGICNLCNGFINMIVRIDKGKHFYIASLQGETARALVKEAAEQANSIVLYENGKILTESTAVLAIFSKLPGLWKMISALRVVPKPLRDSIYLMIAKNRYKIFGESETCRIPTAEEKTYFLN